MDSVAFEFDGLQRAISPSTTVGDLDANASPCLLMEAKTVDGRGRQPHHLPLANTQALSHESDTGCSVETSASYTRLGVQEQNVVGVPMSLRIRRDFDLQSALEIEERFSPHSFQGPAPIREALYQAAADLVFLHRDPRSPVTFSSNEATFSDLSPVRTSPLPSPGIYTTTSCPLRTRAPSEGSATIAEMKRAMMQDPVFHAKYSNCSWAVRWD